MNSTTQVLEALLGQVEARVRAALGRLGVPELQAHAEDIAQEVRVRLWRAMEGERKPSFPASYLHKVVISTCIDAVRAFHARPDRSRAEPVEALAATEFTVLSPSGDDGPESLAHDRQLLDRLRAQLLEMPDDTRRLVLLHAQGFTTAEIAQLTGNSEPAVRNRLYRTLSRLRESMSVRSVPDG